MLMEPAAKDPVVLSYRALRRAVGVIALGLPVALVLPWWIRTQSLLPSLSSYYYTDMRNLFVGSLCPIAMFMFCCRGYDRRDEIAGIFSALCTLGVAFLPTDPDGLLNQPPTLVGVAHYVFAASLIATLAYFCLFLFRLSAVNVSVTLQKVRRNGVYRFCGWTIVALIGLMVVFKLAGWRYLFGGVAAKLCFESLALMAFGLAWLTKGEAFLKDHPSNVITSVAGQADHLPGDPDVVTTPDSQDP